MKTNCHNKIKQTHLKHRSLFIDCQKDLWNILASLSKQKCKLIVGENNIGEDSIVSRPIKTI